MRSSFLALTALTLPHHTFADCKSPLVNTALRLFNVSGIDALPNALLEPLQHECANGHCPKVALPCGTQSIDDIQCELPVFEVPVKIGTDLVCNTACNVADVPCKVACNGINVGICTGADFLLCKAGCVVGFLLKNCVEKCQETIVDPCKQALITDCNNGCDATFQSCQNSCDSVLTMQVTGDLERLENVISSLSIPDFDVDCHGDGLFRPLVFNASLGGRIGDLGLALKIHTKDAGISTTQTIDLDHLTGNLNLPVAGSIQCGRRNNINITIGAVSLTEFSLDVDLDLNKALATIAAVICLDLPFCKNGIQDGINSALRAVIMGTVPSVVQSLMQPLLQAAVSGLKCPGSSLELDDFESIDETEVVKV